MPRFSFYRLPPASGRTTPAPGARGAWTTCFSGYAAGRPISSHAHRARKFPTAPLVPSIPPLGRITHGQPVSPAERAKGRSVCRPQWRRNVSAHQNNWEDIVMLKWALICAIIAIIAAALGFTGVAGAAAGVAKFLFFAFLVIFVIMLIAGLAAGRKVKNTIDRP
jgi:uncharacterized membrane protein YtjA (UPF0391 family)